MKDIPFAEQARRIGFVLQHPDDQIVTDKVFHELAFGLESLGCDEKTMRLRVAEMASYFGIADWFERDVHTLSGGQKQMLNLASVVVMRPDVLILDEPTSQLDPIAASTFLHTLRKLNEELGLTILLSEQRLEEAVPLADHLIVLERGRLLASGAPQEAAAAVRGHAIFSAMPTAARIAAALGAPEHLPLTVREGQAYLRGYAQHPLPEAKSAPAQAQPVLRVRDGWFRYAQNAPDVLRGFSLALRPGELYALTGSNGGGKTTALGVLCRAAAAVSRQRVSGREKASARSSPCATASPPCRRTRARSSRRTRCAPISRRSAGDAALVDTVVQQMALAPLLDRHPFDISGGEQQRAALAKVLLMQPRVLLLDEPTKGMDGAFKAEFGALLRTLCAQGTAVCIVSTRCGVLRAVCRPLRSALSRRGRDGKRPARVFLRQLFLHHGGGTHRAHRCARRGTVRGGRAMSHRLTRRTWAALGILLWRSRR
ncbi:MAG: ATP-binding cassette domain-containing protein [Oscillospiraceae bacterium]